MTQDETNKRIAVIEDDPSVRKGLGRLLRAYGFDVQLYESAEQFLHSYADLAPHCMVLDIQLPGMSGTELVAELRKHGAQVPTVVLTGVEVTEDLADELGSERFGAPIPILSKPFDASILLQALEDLLQTPT